MTALTLGEAERRRVSEAEARVDQAKRSAAARQRRTRWGLVAPALFVVGLFGIGPLLIMLIYSFLEPGTYGGVRWEFSTDAYVQFLFERDLFDDTKLLFTDSYLMIVGRSILLAFVTTIICLILGYPTAYFMATRPASQRNFWVFLITLPFWTNLLIRTYAMFVILRDDGIINNALLNVGLISTPIPIMFTDYAITIGLLYAFLPLMVLPLYASLEKLDFRLVEAGFDLYASRGSVLRRIIVPLSKPGIVAGCILVFIPAIGAYVTPTLMGGGKQLMIGNLIALQFQGARNWPFGAALALILMLVVLIALLFYTRNATRQQAAIHG
jgi:spermidine/putrescine transport system permease protein